MRALNIFAATSLLCAACAGSSATNPDDSANSSTGYPIAISGGTTPTISWTGGSGTVLLVTDESSTASGTHNMWGFFNRINLTFTSPVVYGTMPANTECGILQGTGYCPTPTPLVKGRAYKVSIGTSDLRTSSKTFVP